MNRVVVSIAPPHRCVKRIPASWGKAVLEVGGELLERRRPLVVLGRDAVAGVVHGVVAAPQDPVVGGPPEVVELVAGVRHALAAGPADRVQLGRRERLRHQDVVVDRDEDGDQAPHPAAVRGGGHERMRRLHAPTAVDVQRHAAGPPPDPRDPRPLVDRRPAALRGGRQAPGQLGRVDHHAVLRAGAEPRQPARGVDLGLDRVTVQEREAAPVALAQLHVRGELRHLVRLRRHPEGPRRLQLRVDALVAHEGHQLCEVPLPLRLEDRRSPRRSGAGRWTGRASARPRRTRRCARSRPIRHAPPPARRPAGTDRSPAARWRSRAR